MAKGTTLGRRRSGARTRRVVFGAKKRAAFLAELAVTSNVAASARAVGVQESTIYKLRQRDLAFRRAWAAALAEGYAKLELTLLERAINGTARSDAAGETAACKTRDYPDRLALALLTLHGKAVAEERARAEAEARDGEGGAQDDPVAVLIGKLDAMGDRLRAEG